MSFYGKAMSCCAWFYKILYVFMESLNSQRLWLKCSDFMYVMFLWCFCFPARVTCFTLHVSLCLPPSVPSEARDHHCVPGHETSETQ